MFACVILFRDGTAEKTTNLTVRRPLLQPNPDTWLQLCDPDERFVICIYGYWCSTTNEQAGTRSK